MSPLPSIPGAQTQDARVSAVPLLGDLSLEQVQELEHFVEGGFASTPIAGLDGDLQQRSGRPSQRIRIVGLLLGEGAMDALGKLQSAALAGQELTFSSDITTALDLQRVIIASLRAGTVAGFPQQLRYEVLLVESPPLPPPAQVSSFGGLDEFGVGDLGFENLTDVLGEITEIAGDVAAAVDQALDVMNALGSLANLDALNPAGLLEPIGAVGTKVSAIGGQLKDATGSLAAAFST